MSDKNAPEPMDSTAPEKPEGEVHQNRSRTCYAAKTLIDEVKELFPETTYDITDYNDRNVGLGVRFHTSEQPGLRELLTLVEGDQRVLEVVGDDSQTLRILFRNWARTQDLRDPFGLDEAWTILDEDLELAQAGIDGMADWAGSTIINTGPDWEGGSAFATSPDIKDGGGA